MKEEEKLPKKYFFIDESGDAAFYAKGIKLLHFHYPNHGPLWKSMMAHHLGDYEAIERKLKNSNENQ